MMRTGNLKSIDHALSYFLLDDNGDIYQIGLLLDKSVEKSLKKVFKVK
jgi:hypothetical protein